MQALFLFCCKNFCNLTIFHSISQFKFSNLNQIVVSTFLHIFAEFLRILHQSVLVQILCNFPADFTFFDDNRNRIPVLLRLKQAFDAQQQFVGNAAHELRTPLALMQARLDLYMSTDHGDSCPETEETIAMLREQTERLSRMVQTLLDMSELKAVPRNDRIQLAPMIEEVLADLSPLAEKSGVTLSQSGEDLWITGSDVLVYRAIFNLVENGVKYNRPGGSVCAAVSRRGEEAMIEIKDTGCGIPEDFRESVFQPFFRVDKSRSREKGGVGLGLSLVWEIVHLHSGDVRVRESSETGTVIEMTLPISAEEREMP